MQGVEPSIRSNASANGVASTDNSSAPSGALRGTQITNELSSPQPSGFVTEKTEANKMLDSAASAHVDGLLINKRLPLGSNELAKDARGEILKIAEKNFDKMQNGSWEEKKAIAAEINKHGQKVEYSNGKTHAPMDLPGVQQLGKVTETFAKARAESLVPQGVTGTPETTDIPPKTQQRVAELMSGPRGFENAVMQRAVDKTAAPAQIFNGEVKAHSQTNVRSSNLTATIANSQAAIQKELAPYTAEGPDGAKRMAAAIGEISKNRDAIVADRGLRKAELYAGVNEKAAPAGRERTDRSRDRSAGGGRE